MSSVYRINRKASDGDIIRMNSVGLSLATIGNLLGCHPTTIAMRLKALNIEPADTRRAFMEDVLATLNENQQEWLADQLEIQGISVKTLVRNLIMDAHDRTKEKKDGIESTE